VKKMQRLDCLIIQQPYASLIAFGKKRWEFRSYDCKKREKIGIAASTAPALRTFSSELNRIAGLLPRGVVLAIADLTNSFFVTVSDLKRNLKADVKVNLHSYEITTIDQPIGEPREDVERAIRSLTWESYVWDIENVRALKTPIPFFRKSRSTWVKVDIPEDAET
jgi:hypothetical protein